MLLRTRMGQTHDGWLPRHVGRGLKCSNGARSSESQILVGLIRGVIYQIVGHIVDMSGDGGR